MYRYHERKRSENGKYTGEESRKPEQHSVGKAIHVAYFYAEYVTRRSAVYIFKRKFLHFGEQVVSYRTRDAVGYFNAHAFGYPLHCRRRDDQIRYLAENLRQKQFARNVQRGSYKRQNKDETIFIGVLP